jgi:GrpB-like predicted nucleotidyltransferase (UPF0157 family)
MSTSAQEDAPIEIVPYSYEWPRLFAEEAQILQAVLKPWLVSTIEHVGSTAIPGLSAKPVIDIIAPVQDLAASRLAIEAARSIGYHYYPYKPEQMHWFCKPSPLMRTHHLHLISWKNSLWQERLAFRDALRKDATLAAEYESLKVSLASVYRYNRDAYTDAKAPFIESVLKKYRQASQGAALYLPD